jgi:hypothetical protein
MPVFRIKIGSNPCSLVESGFLILDRNLNGVPCIIVVQVEKRFIEAFAIRERAGSLDLLIAQIPNPDSGIRDRPAFFVPHVAGYRKPMVGFMGS